MFDILISNYENTQFLVLLLLLLVLVTKTACAMDLGNREQFGDNFDDKLVTKS